MLVWYYTVYDNSVHHTNIIYAVLCRSPNCVCVDGGLCHCLHFVHLIAAKRSLKGATALLLQNNPLCCHPNWWHVRRILYGI